MNILKRKLTIHSEFNHLKSFIESIPSRFEHNEGIVIHKARNELRKIEYDGQTYVIKLFPKPNIINRIAYGFLRASKAKRSYLYADKFLKFGVGSPQPVGCLEERDGLFFGKSYYVSCLSVCPYVYEDLFKQEFDYADDVLRAVGKTTAILHKHGYAHKDYGRKNILFGQMPDGSIRIEIVDLNRMHIGHINMKQGCKNFERLPATPHMHQLMAEEYARTRDFDAQKCYELITGYRQKQPGKINNLY